MPAQLVEAINLEAQQAEGANYHAACAGLEALATAVAARALFDPERPPDERLSGWFAFVDAFGVVHEFVVIG